VGEGHTLESDHYIIDVEQLENVGGAPVTPAAAAAHVISSSSNHIIPTSVCVTRNAHKILNSAHMMPTSSHVISTSAHVNPTSSHMISRRSGGDIIKLLKMTSPADHAIPSNDHVTSSFDVSATPSSQSG